MILAAKVAGEKDGRLWLSVRIPPDYQGQTQALVEFVDPRRISPKQRRKAYVLINYIADWAGYIPKEAEKEILKAMFLADGVSLHDGEMSLGNCSMDEARRFITWLIEFCLLNDVPIGRDPLIELCEDIPRYVWACAINRKCCVCGKKAECHHEPPIGMGANRKTMSHKGLGMLPLCRKHHNEIHSIGAKEFLRRYMLETVAIDRRIAEKYRLKYY